MPSLPISAELRQILAQEDPPELGPERRPSAWGESEIQQAIQRALDSNSLSAEARALVHGVVLLWHDHLEATHRIAQEIETPDGSWLHGIMHRREPDYSNAKYWFHRTGAHPAFGELVRRAKPLLKQAPGTKLAEPLITPSGWDPFAFVDLIEATRSLKSTAPERACLRQLQAVELETALSHFLGV